MIYDIYGDSIQTAYAKGGTVAQQIYDKSGNPVHVSNVDYTNYSFVQKWASKGINNAQGFDVYDNKVFWVSKSGNDSIPSNCYVWNLSDGTQALNTAYITAYCGHGNNLSFDYPKLYATSGYTPHAYVNAVGNDFSMSLSKTLYLNDGCKDCDACIDETDENILWSLGHNSADTSDNSNPLPYILSKWDLSDLTDNGDGTYTPKKINTINATRPTCYYIQGCKYHDGLLWFASWYPSTHAYVYAVNPQTGHIIYTIDCDTTTEIEGLSWVEDEGATGGYALYVGFQGMMLRKYTFGGN